MSDEVFFDTNILVYAVSTSDPRGDIAKKLVVSGGVISVQVLNEFANVARKKLKWSWPAVAEALVEFRDLCSEPLPIGLDTHEAAMEIAARDRLAFYDALIVASALQAGCSTLLSEDFQHDRKVSGRLTIRNPFASL